MKASREAAERIVEQWDKHDRFRTTEADRALWGGPEPQDVALAIAYLEARKLIARGVCDFCSDYVNVHLTREDFDNHFGEQ